MSFFKSKKYKLGGGSTKTMQSSSHSAKPTKERFHVINDSPTEKHKPIKGKAPPRPVDANANNDIIPSFQLKNYTKFDWNLDSGGKDLFPAKVAAGEEKLVELGKDQGPSRCVYVIVITKDDGETETHEFQVTLAKNEEIYELLVDWKNLKNLDGVRLKPDLSSSNMPLKLGKQDVNVEINLVP